MSGPKCSEYEVLANHRLRSQQLDAGWSRAGMLESRFAEIAVKIQGMNGRAGSLPARPIAHCNVEEQSRYLSQMSDAIEHQKSIFNQLEGAERSASTVRLIMQSMPHKPQVIAASYCEIDVASYRDESISMRAAFVTRVIAGLQGPIQPNEFEHLKAVVSRILICESDAQAALMEAQVNSIVMRCNEQLAERKLQRHRLSGLIDRFRGLDNATSLQHICTLRRLDAGDSPIDGKQLDLLERELQEQLNSANASYVRDHVIEALESVGFHVDEQIETLVPNQGELVLRHADLGRYALAIVVDSRSETGKTASGAIHGRAVELADSSGFGSPNEAVESHLCSVLTQITPLLRAKGIVTDFKEDAAVRLKGLRKVKSKSTKTQKQAETRIMFP